MELLHSFTADRIHSIVGVTSETSVPETAVNFVRSMGFFMVVVEQIGDKKVSRHRCSRVEYGFRSFR